MNKIMKTAADFFALEGELKQAYTRIDPRPYNDLLQKLQAYYLHPEVQCPHRPRSGEWTGAKAERYRDFSPPDIRRRCIKVSAYDSTAYTDLYVVYATSMQPVAAHRPADFDQCYWWTLAEPDRSGIVAEYTWPWGEAATKQWQFSSGDRKLTFNGHYPPRAIDRIEAPTLDPAAVADYLLEK